MDSVLLWFQGRLFGADQLPVDVVLPGANALVVLERSLFDQIPCFTAVVNGFLYQDFNFPCA